MLESDKSLIIVEDEPVISILIEELVVDLGWTVKGIACSESDGLSLLTSCRPGVAILDIQLGRETSLRIASACRDRDIPVIFVTGYADPDILQLCGSSPVLTKPFSQDELDRALEHVLNGMPAAPSAQPQIDAR